MKQYTTPEQTAKLIELGFEKPSNTIIKEEPIYREGSIIDWKPIAEEGSYSIGELMAVLPENVAKQDEMPSTLNISLMNGEWCVQYADFLGADFEFCNTELVDALFDMVVKLKERGVI